MKKFIFIFFTFLISCDDKNKTLISKDFLAKECHIEIQQLNIIEKAGLSEDQILTLCDCVVEKMIKKYKYVYEYENDSMGAKHVARECKSALNLEN